MTEYTRCPGGCRSKVKIWGTSEISYCCHPCWTRAFADMRGEPIPTGPRHSYQCVDRQDARYNYRTVPTGDREWMISGPRRTSTGAPVVQSNHFAEAPRPMRWGVPDNTEPLEHACTPVACPSFTDSTWIVTGEGRLDFGALAAPDEQIWAWGNGDVLSAIQINAEEIRRGYHLETDDGNLVDRDDTPVHEVP